MSFINNGNSLLSKRQQQQQQQQSLHIKVNFPALDAAPLFVTALCHLLWFDYQKEEAWEEECGKGTPRCFVGYAETNGNVCVSFLIFCRCLFCKTGTSTGGAPSPSLSLSLSPRPFLLSFHLSAGKCHLTLFFLPHDFSGFVFPFICITNYAGSRCSTFPLSNLSSLLLFIGNCKRLVVAGFSLLSLSLSISSCCKHRLTIQLFFIFLFCLLQSSTAAATVPHPSGWGSVAVATTTVTKKINLHAASSARPRWQHCIKHTNTLTHTHMPERENRRAQLLFVCCNELALPLSLSFALCAGQTVPKNMNDCEQFERS